MAIVSGTFAATGTSEAIALCHGIIAMDFAGTATVDIEEQISTSGSWIKVATGITADYRQNYDSPVLRTLRLNCTAYTNDVVYRIESN